MNKKDGLLFAIILALAALVIRQEREKESLLLEPDDVHDVLYEQKERVKELKHELSQVGFLDPVPYSIQSVPLRNPHVSRNRARGHMFGQPHAKDVPVDVSRGYMF